MKRVLFVTMPFAGLDRPALGVSLLQSALARLSVPADCAYFNILGAELMGPDFYRAVSNHLEPESTQTIPYTALAGDWMFSQWFYGPGSLDAQRYVDEVLRERFHVRDEMIGQILCTRAIIPGFLEACLQSVDWRKYWLVGFTTTFEQNMASLSLARLLKERYPRLLIAFGGANCEGVMGEELARQYEFIDYVAMGEADDSFPSLVRTLQEERSPEGIKGIVWRRNGIVVSNGPAEMVRDLDRLPYPNFDDYFSRFRPSPLSGTIYPWLQMESARGCWWGERSHCTFCGLNGATMAFRAKSFQRALGELYYLTDRYQRSHVAFVDNILNPDYFKSLLPELARRRPGLHLFYETKSNFKKHQVRLLRDAGVDVIQPGIESLSTPILKLMGKGVTALQNVAFLKWCRQYGISSGWNLLYGFPREDPAEYGRILDILKRITHLQVPDAVGPIRLDRFSPNYNQARMHGLVNLRPLLSYRFVYPFDDEALSRICYFFDFDYADDRRPYEYAAPVTKFWYRWRADKTGRLTHSRLADGSAMIEDTRFNRVISSVKLDPVQDAIYEFCDRPRNPAAIKEHLESMWPERAFESDKIAIFLDYLVEAHLMIRDADSYLSTAPTETEEAPEPERPRIQLMKELIAS